MESNDERIAVLETKLERMQSDQADLFRILREHMEMEEARWEQIRTYMSRQKGFLAGIVFITSALWGVGVAAAKYFHS